MFPRSLERHQASGTHIKTRKLTSDDNIRKIYSEHVKDGIAQVEGSIAGQDETKEGLKDYALPCGWALKTAGKQKPHRPEV